MRADSRVTPASAAANWKGEREPGLGMQFADSHDSMAWQLSQAKAVKQRMGTTSSSRWTGMRAHGGTAHASVKRTPTTSSLGMRNDRVAWDCGSRHGLCTDVK